MSGASGRRALVMGGAGFIGSHLMVSAQRSVADPLTSHAVNAAATLCVLASAHAAGCAA